MILDIIAVIIVGIGFYAGYSRGLIKTVFDTLSILIAVLFALKLSPTVIGLVDNLITNNVLSFILGFAITFLTVMFLIRMIGKQLESLLKTLNINFINQIAGGAIMSVFYALILSFVLWFLNESNVVSKDYQDKSVSYKILEPLPRQSQDVFKKFKPLFTGFWDKVVEMTDDVKEKAEELEAKDNAPSGDAK